MPNKTTAQAKKLIEDVVEGLGGYENMLAWAKKHQTQFYMHIFPKLLPLQVNARAERKEVVMYETVDEVRAEMASRGIDVDKVIEMLEERAYRPPPKMLEQKNEKTQ